MFSCCLTCSGSEKPGVVVAQLETTDGKVLGSTKFIYKEEISTGFQKLVCSKNYGGRFVKALFSTGTKKDPPLNSQASTSPGKDYPLETLSKDDAQKKIHILPSNFTVA